MAELKEVSIERIAGGVVGELFDHEWARILADIDNPNTNPEAVRSVTITISVKPDETRQAGGVSVAVKSKLAGLTPGKGTIWFGREGGRLVAYERDVAQYGLQLQEEEGENKADAEGSD